MAELSCGRMSLPGTGIKLESCRDKIVKDLRSLFDDWQEVAHINQSKGFRTMIVFEKVQLSPRELYLDASCRNDDLTTKQLDLKSS